MKKLMLVFTLVLAAVSMSGQDIVGKWNGVLVIPGGELRVDFNITKTDDGFTSTLDSPDQNAYGIPTTSTQFKDKTLTITVTDLTIKYEGKLTEKDLIEGTFSQSGQVFDMALKKNKEEE